MKCLILIFSFLYSITFSSQNLLVEYDYFYNSIDKTFTYNNYLISNEGMQYFIMITDKYYEDYESLENDSEYEKSNLLKSLKYSKIDNVYGISKLPESKKNVVYNDSFKKMDWEISKEKESILSYNCKIAYTTFRGRTYKAWFTEEIPFSLGPWKIGGLPGLILKLEDSERKYSYLVKRIVQNRRYTVPKKLIKYYELNNNKEVSYKEYINLENKEFLELNRKMFASLPKNSNHKFDENVNLRDLFLEKSFEWEETKKP